MNAKSLFKYAVSFPLIATGKFHVSNDINSTLRLVLLTEVTELKVMVPTATVTVIHYISTGRKENDYHKKRKAFHMHKRTSYSSWETHNLKQSRALLPRTQRIIH